MANMLQLAMGLLLTSVVSVSEGGGSNATGAHAVMSHDCLAEVGALACKTARHAQGHHLSLENGGRVKLNSDNCMTDNHDDEAICTPGYECTTCPHYNCLLCLEAEQADVYSEPLGIKFLFLVGSLLMGAAVSTLLESLPRYSFRPPFTVVMFCLGAVLAWLGEQHALGCALSDSINSWKHQDPHSVLFALLPPLLFESAFNVNTHVFKEVVKTASILATSGVLVSTALTGFAAILLFGDEFDRIQYENPMCSTYGTGTCADYPHREGESGHCPPLSGASGYGSELRDADGFCCPEDFHSVNGTCVATSDSVAAHRRLSTGGSSGGGPLGCFDCSMDKWWAAWMFGAIVSATDPVAVVAVLQTLGAPQKLGHMIEGESLLNDGSAVVIFLVFKGLLSHQIQEDGGAAGGVKMMFLVLRLAGGGLVLGAAFAYLVYVWLRASRRLNADIEISILVLSVYLVFYVSEFVFGASGVLATVVYGLCLASKRHLFMTVETAEQNEVVWGEIGYVANSFTFALAGLIFYRIVSSYDLNMVANEVRVDERFDRGIQLLLAVALYFILFFVRLFAIFAHFHLLRLVTKEGYKVEWKEAVFMTYAGLRGAVSLCVALFVDHMDNVPQLVKDVIIFHTCLCVFFTIFINGITAGAVYKWLKLGAAGDVRGSLDAGAIRTLSEAVTKYSDTMRGHWFHGEHNTGVKGADVVKRLMETTLLKDDSGFDLPPLSRTGELQLKAVDVNALWGDELMDPATKSWSNDPLRRTIHIHKFVHKFWRETKNFTLAHLGLESVHLESHENGLTKEDVEFHREVHYVPHHKEMPTAGHVKSSLQLSRTNKESPYASILDKDGDGDVSAAEAAEAGMIFQYDLSMVYLNAIKAHYLEEHEEGKLTAVTCHYLCSAIDIGADYVTACELSTTEFKPDDIKAMQLAHEALKNHIQAFDLGSGSWTLPPIQLLQVMLEAYYAEYEAHEQVSQYLHTHLDLGDEISKQFRAECHDICEDVLQELSRHGIRQHTIMPVAHTFQAFRCVYLYTLRELDKLKLHGLMSSTCYQELQAHLAIRYQDISAELSADGVTGAWMWVHQKLFQCSNTVQAVLPDALTVQEAVRKQKAESKWKNAAKLGANHAKMVNKILAAVVNDEWEAKHGFGMEPPQAARPAVGLNQNMQMLHLELASTLAVANEDKTANDPELQKIRKASVDLLALLDARTAATAAAEPEIPVGMPDNVDQEKANAPTVQP